MSCELCEKLTKKFLKDNPDKYGYILCEDCFEKSKNDFVYINLSYDIEPRV